MGHPISWWVESGGLGFVLSRPSEAWTGHPILWWVSFARGNRRSFGRLSDLRMTESEVGGARAIPGLKIQTWGTRSFVVG